MEIKVSVYEIISYYGVFVGVTSFWFDFKTRKFCETTFTKYWAFCVNLVALVALPLSLWFIMNILVDIHFNIVLTAVSTMQSYSLILTAYFTILTRRKREKHVLAISQQIVQLRSDFFVQVPVDRAIELKFVRLFLLKVAVSMYIMLGDAMASLNLPTQYTWYMYLVTVLRINATNVLPLTTLHYFQMMAFMSRDFLYLNKHLHEVLQHFQATRDNRQAVFSQKQLKRAQRVHWRLSGIACQLNHIYRYQMLTSRLTCFTTTLSMGYYLFMFMSEERTTMAQIAFGIFTYMVMVFDLYLVDYIWYDVQQNHNATAGILQQFIELPDLPPSIDKMCKLFALNLGTFQLRFQQVGLYEVDLSLWFSMIVTVLGYNIMLVQFDIAEHKAMPPKPQVALE